MGHLFITASCLAAVIEAAAGLVLISGFSLNRRARSAADLCFACMGSLGLVSIIWADIPGAWPHRREPDQFSSEQSLIVVNTELQRVAAALGVATDQPPDAMANQILVRLPAPAWHMTAAQRGAFGAALDELPVAQRFPVIVRSIPSDTNSIAFSDEVMAVFHQHHWTVVNARNFGIRRDLAGIIIAVSPAVRSKNDVPPSAKRLIVMLEKAGFAPYGAVLPAIAAGQFELVIGNGPHTPR